MIGQFVFAFGLLGLSGLMLDAQRAAWRVAQADDKAPARCRRYALAKHRRRMLAAAAIGFAGALVAVYSIVPRQPVWMTAYLAAMVGGVAVMLICAAFDVLAGARFYRESHAEQTHERAKLLAEIEQAAKNKATHADDGS